MIRAFLGLELPAPLRSQLAVAQFLLPIKDRLPPENFHITLVFLGESPAPQLEELHLALDARRLGPALDLHLAGFGLFGKDDPHNLHACVAPSAGLNLLHERLTSTARRCGFAPPARRFAPHVTLSRLPKGSFNQKELETALVRDALFRSDTFTVSDVVLFRSTLHRKGAQYDELARYPLD